VAAGNLRRAATASTSRSGTGVPASVPSTTTSSPDGAVQISAAKFRIPAMAGSSTPSRPRTVMSRPA
jgi:hypothetical protein